MQITLGLPEPKEFSSLPRLQLVQAGIQRTHSQRSPLQTRIRLPITPAILNQLCVHWNQKTTDRDTLMIWAAATLCFFGFFRSGEITVPSKNTFDPSRHLAWGDISINDPASPRVLKVHLKKSKCDQLGQGVDVFVGRTHCPLYPVMAVLSCIVLRGTAAGPLFQSANGITSQVWQALQAVGLTY